jgi:bifunctional DNA-binding transcriptional regulator/antitoxin component of YhaV-PrlF toxin-antitoxin module
MDNYHSQEIRDYLKLETGSKVEFVIDESGDVKIVPLNVPLKPCLEFCIVLV